MQTRSYMAVLIDFVIELFQTSSYLFSTLNVVSVIVAVIRDC